MPVVDDVVEVSLCEDCGKSFEGFECPSCTCTDCGLSYFDGCRCPERSVDPLH